MPKLAKELVIVYLRVKATHRKLVLFNTENIITGSSIFI